MFFTILIFVIILGLLIFVHELGHFLAAKRNGVRVDEFGFGFPPRILGLQRIKTKKPAEITERRSLTDLVSESFNQETGETRISESIVLNEEVIARGPEKEWRIIRGPGQDSDYSEGKETIYSINAIPLGGFVKIYGEDGEGTNSSRSYTTKKPWRKATILFAGVTMNFLLAVFLFSFGNFIGLPTALTDSEINSHPDARLQILAIAPGSPAENAGVKIGDFVVKLKASDGKVLAQIIKPSDFQNFVEAEKNNTITVLVERGGQRLELGVTPRPNPPAGQGPIGVELASVAKVSLPWYRAVASGFLAALSLIGLMFSALAQIIKNIFIQGRAGVDVVGPVGIFNLTGQAASLGFIYVLQLTAILSVNLSVINALPFPALDGGRALFLLIEKIKGSPLNEKFARTANTIGFAFLIALMIFVTLRDVIKTF